MQSSDTANERTIDRSRAVQVHIDRTRRTDDAVAGTLAGVGFVLRVITPPRLSPPLRARVRAGHRGVYEDTGDGRARTHDAASRRARGTRSVGWIIAREHPPAGRSPLLAWTGSLERDDDGVREGVGETRRETWYTWYTGYTGVVIRATEEDERADASWRRRADARAGTADRFRRRRRVDAEGRRWRMVDGRQ